MSRTFLSADILALLHYASQEALKRQDKIRTEDLFLALLASPIGQHFHHALETIPTSTSDARPSNLRLILEETIISFDLPSEQLFLLGAEQVILGDYLPKHLATAIIHMALTSRAPFAHYGLNPQKWRDALKLL